MSDCEVIEFPGESTVDVPTDLVLATAVKAQLTEVVVVGWRPDGTLFLGTSSADPRSVELVVIGGGVVLATTAAFLI